MYLHYPIIYDQKNIVKVTVLLSAELKREE